MRKRISTLGAVALIAAVTGFVLRGHHVEEPSRHGIRESLTGGRGSLRASPAYSENTLPDKQQDSSRREELFHALPAISEEETVPTVQGEFTRRRIVKTDNKYPYILVESLLCRGADPGSEKVLVSKAMVADQIMVQLQQNADMDAFNALVSDYGGYLIRKIRGTEAYLVGLPRFDLNAVSNAVEFFSSRTGIVATVDCNGICFPSAIPNDAYFIQQWGLRNTGQNSGTPGTDIDAVKAWNITTGNTNVIVAVLDSGVMYTHEDLSANIWTNKGEMPGNGVDDDGNGFIDDVRGWDFGNDDNKPMDEYGHGTAVAGVLGAKGSNYTGLAGVCWNVSIMVVKMTYNPASGLSDISDTVDAIYYAVNNGAHIINFSNGSYGYSSLQQAAITRAQEAGILFVCGSGNTGEDRDVIPYYPCAYTNPNIIACASVDHNDRLRADSAYGATTVDIGAPGVAIWTTELGGSYGPWSGTSFAAPHVAGTAALLKSANPSWGWLELKEAILNNVDPLPSLSGKCVSHGRLNAYKALIGSIRLEIEQGYSSEVGLRWNALNGVGFQVQGSTNLLTDSWHDIGSLISGTGTMTNLFENTDTTSQFFYRFKVQ